jgi:hypothetical protein
MVKEDAISVLKDIFHVKFLDIQIIPAIETDKIQNIP